MLWISPRSQKEIVPYWSKMAVAAAANEKQRSAFKSDYGYLDFGSDSANIAERHACGAIPAPIASTSQPDRE